MQRIRFGLIGLSVVFLFVLLGAAVRGLGSENGNAAQATAAPTGNVAAQDEPREPLAELGVAPGNAPDESANTAKPAPARPR